MGTLAVFPVSISYVSVIKVGDPVELRISAINRTISGKVARFSRKVETATRTMEAEVNVDNADLPLIPGIYATAVLRTDRREKTMLVPIESVLREKGGAAYVWVIDQDRNIEERPVTARARDSHKVGHSYRRERGRAGDDRQPRPSRPRPDRRAEAPGSAGRENPEGELIPRLRMSPLLSAEEFAALQRLDTCTVANAIETQRRAARVEAADGAGGKPLVAQMHVEGLL